MWEQGATRTPADARHHQKKFIKLLKDACGRFNLWDVFNDFLYAMAAALSNPIDKEHFQEREENYLKIMQRYLKRERLLFPQMAAELVESLQACAESGHYEDILGQTFHELELHNKWKGQFFTPQSISDMMGLVAYNEDVIEQSVAKVGYATVYEPCCGSGANLIGFLNAYHEKAGRAANHSNRLMFVAQDLDPRCCWMCYIQLALYGIPAVVEQRNTLTMKLFDTWYTPAYVLGGWELKERWRRLVLQMRSLEKSEAEQMGTQRNL